jgi:hypothetical protein
MCHAFFLFRAIHKNPNPSANNIATSLQYGGSNPIFRNTTKYPAATSTVGPSTIQKARFILRSQLRARTSNPNFYSPSSNFYVGLYTANAVSVSHTIASVNRAPVGNPFNCPVSCS